ncbi:MAG: sulfatase, partial [Chloroflexota bacterium]
MTLQLPRRRFLALAGAGALGASSLISACASQTPKAPSSATLARLPEPNVLVIILDTIRYDRFARPAETSLTPNLDRLAAAGIRFDNAWATSSWSLPAQASILTGHYAHVHGADWPGFGLAKDVPTLAEVLSRRGYATGAFSGNAAWVTPEYLGRGFLRFDAYTAEDHLRRTVNGRAVSRLLDEVGMHIAGRGKKAPRVNAEFQKFLNDYPDRPFFAYVCYMDVNQGFHNQRFNAYFRQQAPTSEVVAAYDRSLRELDNQVGALLDDLQRRSVLNNTLIVVVSDHGESFGPALGGDHDPIGHGTSLYPEQARVPLFVTFPGRIPAGLSSNRTVSISAIPSTVTEVLGYAESPFPGPSLLGRLQSTTHAMADDTAILTTLRYGGRELQSVVRENLQYVRDLSEASPSEELFDLAADPSASVNRVADHPDLDRMRALA